MTSAAMSSHVTWAAMWQSSLTFTFVTKVGPGLDCMSPKAFMTIKNVIDYVDL
jgi:hypothetical protein